MSLIERIFNAYPELTPDDFGPASHTVVLQDDADGYGVYLAEWNYSKPPPEGVMLGKSELRKSIT